MGKRVSLLQTPVGGNRLVTTSKRNRLERKKRNLLWVIQCKADDRSNLIIVNAVYQRRDQNNLYPSLVKIINPPQLHIEQISYLAVAIRVIANTVKLEIHITQSSFCRLTAKLFTFCELNPVSGRLDRVIPDLARVLNRLNEVR